MDTLHTGKLDFLATINKVNIACMAAVKELTRHLKAEADAVNLSSKRDSSRRVDSAGGSMAGASARLAQEAQAAQATAELEERIQLSTELIRMLQLLTEGHMVAAQEYFDIQSLTIITEVLDTSKNGLVASMSPPMAHPLIPDLVVQISEFFTEVLNGPNSNNQHKLATSTDLITVIGRFLKDRSLYLQNKMVDGSESSDHRVMKVNTGIVGAPDQMDARYQTSDICVVDYKVNIRLSLFSCMTALVEGCIHDEVLLSVIDGLDPDVFVESIFSVYGSSEADDEDDTDRYARGGSLRDAYDAGRFDTCEELVSSTYASYILMQYLNDFIRDQGISKVEFANAVEKLKSEERALGKILGSEEAGLSMVSYVEISRSDLTGASAVYKVYFRVKEDGIEAQRMFRFKKTVDDRIEAIDRDNPDFKAQQIMHQLKSLVSEMTHIVSVNHSVLQPLLFLQSIITELPLYVATVGVVILLLTYGSHDEPFAVAGEHWEYIFFLSTLVHIGVSFLFALSYFAIDAPNQVLAMEYEMDKEIRTAEKRLTVKIKEEPIFGKPYNRKLPPIPKMPRETGWFKKTCLLFSTFWPYYYIIYFAMSVAVLRQPFILPFLLMDYLRSDGGMVVMASVVVGGPGLLRSGAVGIILILVFGSLSFMEFADDINAINAGSCVTAWNCIGKAFDYGIRGGLETFFGDDHGNFALYPQDVWTDGKNQVMTVLVLGFYVFWAFILEGIIQGQIIDAFTEIRTNNDAKRADSLDFCIVCSLSRFQLEHEGSGFKYHQDNEHNPWSYLYFFQYLQVKDSLTYTGMETYVADKVSQDDHSFMPVEAAHATQVKCIEAVVPYAETSEGRLEAIQGRLALLEDAMLNLPKTIESTVKRALFVTGGSFDSKRYDELKRGGDEELNRAILEPVSAGLLPVSVPGL